MNDENNNNMDDMNNINNPGILPGLEPEQGNDGVVLPGMDDETIQNVNQQYENEMGINQAPQNSFNANPYQTNANDNFNPYGNMDMPYGSQEMNGQMFPNTVNQQPMDYDQQINPMYMDQNSNMNMEMNNQGFQDSSMNMGMNNQGYQDYNMNMGMNNQGFQDSGMNTGMENPDFQNSNINGGNGDLESDFIRAWMGSLYEKSLSSKFNWCAALLGPIYLLYRKVYLTGIITLLLETVVSIASIVLSVKSPVAGLAISIFVTIALFVGLGLGFYAIYRNYIKGKLQKLSRQTNDSNSLINVATQKGGTSIIGVLLGILIPAIIIPIVITTLISSGALTFPAGEINTNTTIEEEIADEPEVTNTSSYKFDNEYELAYDMNEWYLDETNNSLTKGDYTFGFADVKDTKENEGKFTSQNFDFVLSSADGRAELLKYINNFYKSLIAQNGNSIQMEEGNDNFVPSNENTIYYNYTDFIVGTAMQRNYSVILPEQNVLLQFWLTINDTSIDDQTNISVINMLSTVSEREDVLDNNDNNLLTNSMVISNEVANALDTDESTVNNNTNTQNINNNEMANEINDASTQQGGNTVSLNPSTNQASNNTALSQYLQ